MKNKNINHKVSIVMGSQSDYSTMRYCEKVLKLLEISYETNIVSAHRTPEKMFKYAKFAEKRNISVVIAGAGGSAHLPGMIASLTSIPVIGVPIESKKLKGLGSLLSIAQMPKEYLLERLLLAKMVQLMLVCLQLQLYLILIVKLKKT